tara:strand:- start:1225 stop:1401 length:177 start_codon:yes stop_codon:yes gene_type:complete
MQTMTARQYVESQGITPNSLYVDIADAYVDWLRYCACLDLSDIQEQERADRFFASFAE